MRGLGFAAAAAGVVLSLAAAVAPAGAVATLLTNPDDYAGPVLDLSAYAGDEYYTFTGGPVTLPGGITFTSTNPQSVIGHGTPFSGYGFGSNGESRSTLIIGSNYNGVITLAFDTPVAAFGAGFNYAPGAGSAYLRAFDVGNVLIAEYDLTTAAPISTCCSYVNETFRFRGIDGGGVGIASFQFTGAYIAAAETGVADPPPPPPPPPGIPEPGAWALMIVGFGLAGSAVRSRRRVGAPSLR